MTVGELAAFLATLPPNAEVRVYSDTLGGDIPAIQAIGDRTVIGGRVDICGYTVSDPSRLAALPRFMVYERDGSESHFVAPVTP